jgi:N-acetyl-beta-hexosaminidase
MVPDSEDPPDDPVEVVCEVAEIWSAFDIWDIGRDEVTATGQVKRSPKPFDTQIQSLLKELKLEVRVCTG